MIDNHLSSTTSSPSTYEKKQPLIIYSYCSSMATKLAGRHFSNHN